ncbi:phage terminase family protein [Bradyrhizobium barranii subsp. apii]|uniref:terminase TerL endonuclease subunit n=1 Tax=Bradyrhizobium barranii TaxID=2992140 RepID=UPI001AA15DE6|nr:terminase TerL endonuclease subunit [Bradyrhizobium barranii]UPT97263.1 phage terminase family protein [Bradyrhizobium barranii subsp. apii]
MTQPDPIAFINAVLRDPATGLPFELLPAEIAFLEYAFNLDETGRAIYPELTFSAPKKSGKTAFAAILTLTATLLYGGRNAEAICCANDLEQSQSRVFSAIKAIVLASPRLEARAKITKSEIVFPDVGASILAIASDAAGAAGANPVISVGDELWGFTTEASRRLWDELVPPPTRRAAWRLVTTYAGYSGESLLLEELYKAGTAQPQIGADLYAGEGRLTFWTHKPVAPWQDDRWLAQMRSSMRPNAFTRIIENRWVTSESAFIEMHLWDQCVDYGLQPLQADRNLQVFVGVDASLKRDSTAIVAVTSDGDRVRLVRHRTFQPSPDQPLDFEATIEAEIIDLCNSFSVQAVRYDPWQMASLAQRLVRRGGVPMEEFPQTTSNLTDSSSNLYELVKANNLQVYADEQLRTSISQAIAVETPRGWRIAKEKQKHKIDVVVALAMASLAAVKQEMMPGFGVFEHYRRASEAAITPPPVADTVRIVWPKDQLAPSHLEISSHGEIAGATYLVGVENGDSVFYLGQHHARVLLKSSFARHDLIAANLEIAASLEPIIEPAGVNINAMRDAIEAQRPIHPLDRGRMAREALRGYSPGATLRAVLQERGYR